MLQSFARLQILFSGQLSSKSFNADILRILYFLESKHPTLLFSKWKNYGGKNMSVQIQTASLTVNLACRHLSRRCAKALRSAELQTGSKEQNGC